MNSSLDLGLSPKISHCVYVPPKPLKEKTIKFEILLVTDILDKGYSTSRTYPYGDLDKDQGYCLAHAHDASHTGVISYFKWKGEELGSGP